MSWVLVSSETSRAAIGAVYPGQGFMQQNNQEIR